MTSEPKSSAGRRDLSSHILSASVVMIGVSTTLIGLVKVAKAHMSPTRVDQYAAVVGLLFLLGAVASYLAIRLADRPDLSRRCEWIADQLFICGLVGVSVIALFFAFEII
jgi:MFS family permease